jgi:hypothetical protein
VAVAIPQAEPAPLTDEQKQELKDEILICLTHEQFILEMLYGVDSSSVRAAASVNYLIQEQCARKLRDAQRQQLLQQLQQQLQQQQQQLQQQQQQQQQRGSDRLQLLLSIHHS